MNSGNMYENTNRVSEAFCTSNAPLSRQLCKDLDAMGPMGQLASLLFKAEKASKQANSYSGKAPVSQRPYGDYSKDRMKGMLEKAIGLLDAHAKDLGIPWGWSKDDAPGKPPWILCIGLPTGVVTFRMPERRLGPDYGPGAEDGCRNSNRISDFCEGVLDKRWIHPKQVRIESTDARQRANSPRNGDSPASVCRNELEEDWL